MDTPQFEGRKREHIQLALDEVNQAGGLAGFDRVRLVHEALPDLDFQDIKLHSTCLGRSTPTPFYVAGMTAGHADAPRINSALAEACQERGWAMGVGSQRRELEALDSPSVDHWSQLRERFPKLALYGNLGVSQLISSPISNVRRLVESIRATALMIHVNALQEAVQPEGTPQFKGALPALKRLCAELDVPVVVKETGCGFSAETLRRLRDTGIAGVDISGLGGTHWGRIEGARAAKDSLQWQAARTFAEWGVPTVESVMNARDALGSKLDIWASGGVRTGLDSAKLIALGAHQVGFAKPALEAALKGEAELRQWMATREFELKVALFCTGCASPSEMRSKQGVWKTTES